ncbi:FtsK/SpoIIIE family DNA translocase [Dongia deserti]|uniref:FtsK/SpoIIIE family DNA translocase n=1 Tax=Dongia deserti TaxID=2268030 RepID=UPI000E649637|nr:DNA translocase FtsK 4TM domain-containing protein [Dongia deserti]
MAMTGDQIYGRPSLPRMSGGGWGAFVRRRLAEIAGGTLLLIALAYLLSVLTAHESDPSFNRAVDGPTLNLMGPIGAHVGDFALQGLGLAAIIFVLAPAAWGWKLIRDRRLERWWLKITLLPLAALLSAGACAAIPSSGQWPWTAGMGGFSGRLLLIGADGKQGLRALLDTLGVPAVLEHPLLLPTLILALAAAVALFFTLGITLGGYIRAGKRVATAGQKFGEALDRGRLSLGRRKADEDDEDEDSAAAQRPGFFKRLFQRSPKPAAAPRARIEPSLGAAARAQDIDLPPAPSVQPEPKGGLVSVFQREKKPKAKPAKRESVKQTKLDFEGEFELPSVDLLSRPVANAAAQRINEESLEKNARLLETVLDDFGVKGQIVRIRPGPVVTLYELEPAPGTKTSRVVSLADDVARSMSAVSVRIAVVPGRSVIGIELPNRERETVALRELLEDDAYHSSQAKLALVLGKDIGGQPIVVDLARMPHLLIAGTTGSGKSVAINTMIMSLLYRLTPDQCKFIMIDPKMLELSVYDDIPHLLSPVVTEPKKAIVALKWVVREMENRYRAMSKLGVRNIEGYNQRLEQARNAGEQLTRRVQTGFDPETGKPIYEEEPFDLSPLPFIVVVVDEMADLMLVAGKDIEAAIQRLAQMARAAGIHIIMATQRPSVDVITGTIKANFPTRVSFHVTTKIDSRTILGETGAEQLLGQGDMLYMANGGRITRIHGPFISDREVESIVKFLKTQGEPAYLQEVTESDEDSPLGEDGGFGSNSGSGDDLYDQAVALVARERKCSTSFIQRYLQIGYNRAARIVERMEKEGVVSQANHVGKREVLAPEGGAR